MLYTACKSASTLHLMKISLKTLLQGDAMYNNYAQLGNPLTKIRYYRAMRCPMIAHKSEVGAGGILKRIGNLKARSRWTS